MKTPREILLQRHLSVEPQLDLVRQKALSSLILIGEKTAPGFREMLFSIRWHLAGLSAAWLFVALLNIDHTPTFTAKIEVRNIPSPQKLLAAIRENRKQLLKVLESQITEPASIPHASLPSRRSERQLETSTA